MIISKSLNTVKQQYRFSISVLRLFIFTLVLVSLSACNNEPQFIAESRILSNEEQNQLLLDIKRAMLDLDIALVEKLSSKIDVNLALPDNSSLLAWAAETQDPRLVTLMLEKGASVQVANGNRFTPIIVACRYGNSEIINALLDRGADPNSAIEDGTNAFHLCAGSAATADLARMVGLGANITAENNFGQTALMWSANFGNVENLNYLVTSGARINHQTKEGYSTLFFAIKSHNLLTVKAAISHGADLFAIAQDGTTAAQLGVYTKNFEFLTWFVSEMNSLMSLESIQTVLSDFDRDGYQLLHAAVNANQAVLVSKLLDLGANRAIVSEPSKLKWRYEANFKTENYYPPQLTPIELAEQNNFKNIVSMLNR